MNRAPPFPFLSTSSFSSSSSSSSTRHSSSSSVVPLPLPRSLPSVPSSSSREGHAQQRRVRAAFRRGFVRLPKIVKRIRRSPQGGYYYINPHGERIWLNRRQRQECARGTLPGAFNCPAVMNSSRCTYIPSHNPRHRPSSSTVPNSVCVIPGRRGRPRKQHSSSTAENTAPRS